MAARVAGAADLLDVRLTHSTSSIDAFPGTEAVLGHRLRVKPDVTASAEGAFIVVEVDFRVRIHEYPDGEERREVAEISCTQAALYGLDLDPFASPAEAEAFAATTGTFALYPYARAFIQDTTARMGLPPLTLGIYRIPITAPTGDDDPD